jgi:hypothetical protein
MNPMPSPRLALLALSVLVLAAHTWLGGCGARSMLRAEMEPLALSPAEPAAAPAPLTKDHFRRDGAGSISEEDLRTVLAAPVFLEANARIGVVPVANRYEPDPDLPLAGVPGVLGEVLTESGLFELATEVSTDWPADRGISGLRELAARYRAEYLLLYRQRFVDDTYTNAWALMWLTVVGGLVVPHETMEIAGVVEATLFDVRTGTLLFTVYERVHQVSDENVWQNDRKRKALKRALLDQAAGRLADRVVEKARLLAAARPAPAVRPSAQAARGGGDVAGPAAPAGAVAASEAAPPAGP